MYKRLGFILFAGIFGFACTANAAVDAAAATAPVTSGSTGMSTTAKVGIAAAAVALAVGGVTAAVIASSHKSSSDSNDSGSNSGSNTIPAMPLNPANPDTIPMMDLIPVPPTPVTPVVMGYYSDWSPYSGVRKYQVTGSIDKDDQKSVVQNPDFDSQIKNLDIVAYAFAEIYPDGVPVGKIRSSEIGKIYFSDPWSDLFATDAEQGKICDATQVGTTASKGSLYTLCFTAYDNQSRTLDSESALPGFFLMGNLTALSQKPNVKKLLSIGGWAHEAGFEQGAFVNPTNFVNSLVYIIKKLNLDGVDFDYEPAAGYTSDNADKLVSLIQQTREAFNNDPALKDKMIAVAIFADPQKMAAFEAGHGNWAKLAAEVNYIGIMGYDYHGGFDNPKTTNFLANLDVDQNDPIEQQAPGTEFSGVRAVRALESYGVPAAKIILGYPSYGRIETGANNANEGLFETFTGTGTNGDMGKDQESYYNIVKQYIGNFTAYDTTSKGPGVDGYPIAAAWAYSVMQGEFLSYDNAATVAQKATFIKDQKLGGAMMWEMISDFAPNDATYGNDSLLCSIRQGLLGTCNKN